MVTATETLTDDPQHGRQHGPQHSRQALPPGSPRASDPAASQPAARLAPAGEYLVFRLGSDDYGIDILGVHEIRSYEQPTRIARAPAWLKGVVNLRGVIVPIIDLRIKLGCLDAQDQAGYDHFTVVIVLNLQGRLVGAVVDSVSDVLALAADDIRPAPGLYARLDSRYIRGVSGVSGLAERRLILLDIEGLMGSPDMGLSVSPQA